MGRALALSLCALLGAFASAEDGPSATPPRPGPRVAIDGIASIDCASVVVYASAPDLPHRLNATYAFPDRARWWLGTGAESSPERLMRLRFGDACYAIEKNGAASRELLAEERTEALVQIEMRRALFLWPHGFEWKREGLAAVAGIGRLGRLTARYPDAKAAQPSAIEFTAEDGRPGDAFRAITWRDDKDKSWPVTLELWHAKERVWSESVSGIDVKTRFIDSYFLPPDRRSGSVSKPVAVSGVRAADLPECRVQRIALKDDMSLAQAFEEWKRVCAARTQELTAQGVALEGKVTVEIDREARPRALLLRLAATGTALPESVARAFEVVRERPALTTFVLGLQAVSKEPVDLLAAAVPGDAVAGAAYLRFDPEKPGEHVLVILPLVAAQK